MDKSILVLLCGCSGAGKSTAAKSFEQFHNYVILSTDEMRGVIGKNENDQSVSGQVFDITETMCEYFLKRGQSVVIDALNHRPKNRKPFVDIARKLGVEIHAVVLERDLETLKAQNQMRERKVPDAVIEGQYKNYIAPNYPEVDKIVTWSKQ